MSDESIDWYLESIGRYELLTAEQEITLGRQVQEWMALKAFHVKKEEQAAAAAQAQLTDQQLSFLPADELNPKSEQDLAIEALTPKQKKQIARNGKVAFDQMYCANLRLVVHIAKKYASRAQHLELLDLVQSGNEGLHRAVEKFDPTLGYKFSTYSYWWIRQSIGRCISQLEHTIRLPLHAYEKISKIRQFSCDYQLQFGRIPSSALICETFKLKPHDLDRMTMVAIGCVSLHATANGGCPDSSMLLDIIPAEEPEESDFDFLEIERVHKVVPTLKEQMAEMEAKVFEASFFTACHDSRAQIARELGISGERARQLEIRSVQRFQGLFELQDAAAG